MIREPGSQSHQLTCQSIVAECEDLRTNKTVKYDDFFGHIDAQIAVTVLYKKVLETRTRLLKERENTDASMWDVLYFIKCISNQNHFGKWISRILIEFLIIFHDYAFEVFVSIESFIRS